MDKIKSVLNTIPEVKDGFIENTFSTNNERETFYLLNKFVNTEMFYKTKTSVPKLLSRLVLMNCNSEFYSTYEQQLII